MQADNWLAQSNLCECMYLLLKSLATDTVPLRACYIAMQHFMNYRIRVCEIDVGYASLMLI